MNVIFFLLFMESNTSSHTSPPIFYLFRTFFCQISSVVVISIVVCMIFKFEAYNNFFVLLDILFIFSIDKIEDDGNLTYFGNILQHAQSYLENLKYIGLCLG